MSEKPRKSRALRLVKGPANVVPLPRRKQERGARSGGFRTMVARALEPAQAIELVRQGLPARTVDEAVAYMEISQRDLLTALRIPISTYHRKLAANESLSSSETEKVVRLAEVARLAESAFGDAKRAREWLLMDNLALGAPPLSLMDTDAGAAQVRRALGVIDFGGVA